MLLHLKRWFNGGAVAGTDQGLCSFPIPDSCRLVQQQGEFKILTESAVDISDAAVYGVQAWLLQSDTPSTDFLDHDVLWDSFVPKPVAGSAAILDISSAADTTAAQEPGQVSITQIFDQEVLSPERIFSREKIIAFGDAPIGFLPGSPNTWIPTDSFMVKSNKSFRAGGGDMGLVYGLSSPDLAGIATGDDDIIDAFGTATDGFYVMKYINQFLDKALVELVGLTEAGAESPYEDIMQWLIVMLERASERSGTGAFTAVTWSCLGKMTCGVWVPGFFEHRSIGPSGQAN